jgi:hypothetical protein
LGIGPREFGVVELAGGEDVQRSWRDWRRDLELDLEEEVLGNDTQSTGTLVEKFLLVARAEVVLRAAGLSLEGRRYGVGRGGGESKVSHLKETICSWFITRGVGCVTCCLSQRLATLLSVTEILVPKGVPQKRRRDGEIAVALF